MELEGTDWFIKNKKKLTLLFCVHRGHKTKFIIGQKNY